MMDSDERKRFRKKVRKLWESNRYTFDEVCQELDMEPGELNRLAERMGLGERPECDVYIPTPEEIRLRTAAMRQKWTQTEREARIEAAHSVTMKYKPPSPDNEDDDE
jgi:hypothetical protein